MKLLSVVGARPNFMKVAPLHRAIVQWNASCPPAERILHRLVHTGQHYDPDLSGVFFRDLALPTPDDHLGVGSGSQAQQVAGAMVPMEEVLLRERPDWVVVVGDVNAALSATLAAKKIPLKVAHIEAGLRSGDWTMPEEINRMVVDRIADLLLATTEGARRNLLAEGIEEHRVAVTGNIMIDTLMALRPRAEELHPADFIPALPPGPFALATLHRPSNVDDGASLREIVEVFGRLAGGLPLLLPLHPRTRARLEEFGLIDRLASSPDVHLTGPLGYPEMLSLMLRAEILLTDSGGLQEEATVLNLPCVTLRPTTERPETLIENGGTALLAGSDGLLIEEAFHRLRSTPPRGRRPPLWDGRTAERILGILRERSCDPPWRTSPPQPAAIGSRPSPTL